MLINKIVSYRCKPELGKTTISVGDLIDFVKFLRENKTPLDNRVVFVNESLINDSISFLEVRVVEDHGTTS